MQSRVVLLRHRKNLNLKFMFKQDGVVQLNHLYMYN